MEISFKFNAADYYQVKYKCGSNRVKNRQKVHHV